MTNANTAVSERAPSSQLCCSSLQTSLQHTGGHQQGEPLAGIPPDSRGVTPRRQHHVPSRPQAAPGLSTATSSSGSALAIAGRVWIQAGSPCPEGCSPLVPGGSQRRQADAGPAGVGNRGEPGGSGWPSTLAGVFSPADKPIGRDRNGAAWRRFVSQMCLSVRARETFTVLLLFKYFNASHLVSYF